MDIAAFEHGQLVHGGSCCGIFSNRAGKRDENFILSSVDADTLKKLGMNLTCDPVYEETGRKYHKI